MQIRIAGLSLVELMVAIGIIGVLGTLAIPRYKQFMVQARRGEAKANLSHLASLQKMYRVDHFKYYDGPAMTGVNGIGYKDGLGNPGKCHDPGGNSDEGLGNHLGFRPDDCRNLRYLYKFRTGNVAEASAASDGDNRWIYPDCDGRGCIECNYRSGDAVTLALSGGKPVVCRNITKYCPVGGVAGGCKCSGSCPAGQLSAPYPQCCVCASGTCQAVHSTSNWTPLANTKYTCQSFTQSATVTETWTSSCPGATTCPSSSTRPTSRPAMGTKAPDCTTAALAACPCTTGDTRSCCTSNPTCTPAGSSESSCDLVDTSVNLATLWECQSSPCKVTSTETFTPNPPCGDKVTNRHENKYGQKRLTCTNICTGYNNWSPWGACAKSSGGYWQSRSQTRKCNNPCPNQGILCSAKYEQRYCLCSDGKTVAQSKTACDTKDNNDPTNSYTHTITPNTADDTKINCSCLQRPHGDPPRCTAAEKDWEKVCKKQGKYAWHDYPDCECGCNGTRAGCENMSGKWTAYPACTCEFTNTLFLCPTRMIIGKKDFGINVAAPQGVVTALKSIREGHSNLGSEPDWRKVVQYLYCKSHPLPNEEQKLWDEIIQMQTDATKVCESSGQSNKKYLTWSCP